MSVLPPDDDRTMLALPAKTSTEPAAKLAPSPGRENESNALRHGDRVFEFEITQVIGVGGFGIVYLAYDHSLQRNIALKEYMPSSLAERTTQAQVAVKSERHTETFEAGLRSFINEARLLAQFDHPSLLKVYRFWEANGTAYMVMPFYEGLTLKQTLKALPKPPDEAWLKALLAPLLDALETLHYEQCYHRDIAPDNILMLGDGRPLLLDFGAARRAITGLNQAFTVILKPGYAPIEQYADVAALQQGAWTDVYALASVVHFAMVGRPPPPSATRMISDTQVPLATAVAGKYSAPFLQVLDKCLSVQPKDRPQSVATLRAQLQLESHFSTQHAQPAGLKRRTVTEQYLARVEPAKPKLRNYALLWAGGIIMAGAAIWYLTGVPAHVGVQAGVKPIAVPVMPQRVLAEASATTAPPVEAAAPLPPTEVAVPSKPIDALTILDQIFEGRDRNHAVTISLPKPQVRIGKDRLQMSVSSTRAGYLYLLMVGTNRADFTLLFPNVVDKDNRIAAGKSLDLPRKKWALGAFGPAGADQFVMMVSPYPRQFRDAGIRQGELFAEFPSEAIAQATAVAPGGLSAFAGKTDCTNVVASQCTQAYGASQFSIVEVDAK